MGRVYCVSDLHGQYDLFKKIKEHMKEDDVCCVLGDCVDRGPSSIKIILDIMADKRFKMLLGNHEQMMLEALKLAEEGVMDFRHWYENGGYETHCELMTYDRKTQIEILAFVDQLPMMIEYKDVIMTHAGFSFALEEYAIKEMIDDDMLLWGRSHITSLAKSKLGKVQVHGHTPSACIKEGAKGILQYSEGKYCVDTGCCFDYPLGMLDLDSFEEIYFDHEI